jgi:uncharacterized membrane protein
MNRNIIFVIIGLILITISLWQLPNTFMPYLGAFLRILIILGLILLFSGIKLLWDSRKKAK